ncbi:MAG: FAD:protein FMN transferase [Pseudomonadota bacterium]|nr:FAD:protein FMN transferase [Pseudomonadota bacterium]
MTASLLLVAACSKNDPVYSTTFTIAGERIHIATTSTSKARALRIFSQLKEDSLYIEKYWNPLRSGTLQRTNTLLSSGKQFSAPPSIIPMIKLSQKYAQLSNGKYDAARGKYLYSWGYYNNLGGKASATKASLSALSEESLLPPPRSSDVNIDDFRLQTDNPNVMFDFGLLGKGYSLEMFAKSLRENGIYNAIINIGGDFKAIGTRSGAPWNVGIPRGDNTGVLATINIAEGESVMTLGRYNGQSIANNPLNYPVYDPATQAPVEHTTSVTVLHRDATLASAAAQALFAAGPQQWQQTAIEMGVEEVLLIDNQGKIHLTASLHDRLDFTHMNPDLDIVTLSR